MKLGKFWVLSERYFIAIFDRICCGFDIFFSFFGLAICEYAQSFFAKSDLSFLQKKFVADATSHRCELSGEVNINGFWYCIQRRKYFCWDLLLKWSRMFKKNHPKKHKEMLKNNKLKWFIFGGPFFLSKTYINWN